MIQDLPVNDLEGVWEDDNEEKSYTFFRATFDGQDFAIFAKDSFDTNLGGNRGPIFSGCRNMPGFNIR